MSLQAFLVASAMAATVLTGRPPRDPHAGPAFVKVAAGRLFLDVTPALRGRPWRGILDLAARNVEARAAPILRELQDDPRLAPVAVRPGPVPRALFSLLFRKLAPIPQAHPSPCSVGARAPGRHPG